MRVKGQQKCEKMQQYFVIILVLSVMYGTKCELSLKILKCTEGNYSPVSSVVEERVGANFSLLCDLMSSETNNKYYDFQVSWITPSSDLRFWREQDFNDLDNGKKSKKIYSILTPSEVNKAVKKFDPLKLEDRGKYYCVSLKYNLHESVEVVVRDDRLHFEDRRAQDASASAIFCSDQMFMCATGVCIISHYVCDGRSDCKDGSDESEQTCNGNDPCKDKLQCDGRCIPTSWCCDKNVDPNCTVVNRPKCCQVLSESYEELEYGAPGISQTHNGPRYVFISVCVLSILFVIVLILLVLSKVLIFANKETAIRQRHLSRGARSIEAIALRNQLRNCRLNFATAACDVAAYNNRMAAYQNRDSGRSDELMLDGCDVSDPLLYPLEYISVVPRSDEQPPSYIDVVRSENVDRSNMNEPPPPYTSRENVAGLVA